MKTTINYFRLCCMITLLTGMYKPLSAQWTTVAPKVFLTTGSNKVGIGTTTPARHLHIYGSGDQEIAIQSTDAGAHQWTLQSNGTANVSSTFQIVDRTLVQSRLAISNNGNVGIGIPSPAYKLDVNGSINLQAGNAVYFGGIKSISVTNGTANTAVGAYAMPAVTGVGNNAFGYSVLKFTTTGSWNTAMGYSALTSNTLGSGNTAFGHDALYVNTTGSNNTACGQYALESYMMDGNTAVGNNALANNLYSNGIDISMINSNNTALGTDALLATVYGGNNVACGYSAGSTGDGSMNTILGAYANTGVSLWNTTAIGSGTTSWNNNYMYMGNTSQTWIGGQVGWSTYSDARIKNQVQENVPGLAFINLLKPVTYHYDINKENEITGQKNTGEWSGKHDVEKTQFSGFLAQDVAAAAKKIDYDFSGVDIPKNDKTLYSIRYSDFVVPLVKSVQELNSLSDAKDKKINEQQEQIDALNRKIDDFANQMKNFESAMSQCCSGFQSGINSKNSTSASDVASLEQNAPNPFNESSMIRFYIPSSAKSATLKIMAANGSVLKTFSITDKGVSQISISGSSLDAGSYSYQLTVDGKIIDMKKMVLTK